MDLGPLHIVCDIFVSKLNSLSWREPISICTSKFQNIQENYIACYIFPVCADLRSLAFGVFRCKSNETDIKFSFLNYFLFTINKLNWIQQFSNAVDMAAIVAGRAADIRIDLRGCCGSCSVRNGLNGLSIAAAALPADSPSNCWSGFVADLDWAGTFLGTHMVVWSRLRRHKSRPCRDCTRHRWKLLRWTGWRVKSQKVF